MQQGRHTPVGEAGLPRIGADKSMPHTPRTHPKAIASSLITVAFLAVALTAGCSGGDDNDDQTDVTTTERRATDTTMSNGSSSDNSELDIVEVDVLSTPDEHEELIAAAARVAEQWFTAAWSPRTHEQGDDWIAQLGHPDPDIAEKLHTGPTRRSDDPGEVQAKDYWADIRAVMWNGADAPEDRRWVDDVPGTIIHFAKAVGRTTVPALIASDADGVLAWVRLPVAVEVGSTGTAPDGSAIHVRYLIQGELELRPLDPEDDETALGIAWLDVTVDEDRLNGLRITYEDSAPTEPTTLLED